jgi:hypothetical protein
MRRRLKEVVSLEPNVLAKRFRDPPAVAAFLEPADRLRDGEPALDLELAVDARPGTIDDSS